jgi:hypothetical protein
MQDIATVHKANNYIHILTGIFGGSLVSPGLQSVCSHNLSTCDFYVSDTLKYKVYVNNLHSSFHHSKTTTLLCVSRKS